MKNLTINLDESKMSVLREKASRFGLEIEELVIASIDDLISRNDEEFESAVNRVLSKNAELYRRLG